MKKILLAIILPLLFMGCISSGVTVKVNKDGSGEIVQTFKIKKDFVGFLSMSDEPTDPNLIDMESLNLAAKAMGEGVSLTKVEPMPEDSPYAGYEAYFKFQDISKIKVSASPSTSPEAISDDSNDWISFDFNKGKTSKLTMHLSEQDTEQTDQTVTSENDEKVEASTEEGMGDQLKEIYKDMHYWMKVEVAGNITDTNASFVEGSQITIFDMNFEKIVENDELFKKVTAENPGSMTEYKDELSKVGVFIDDKKEITVSFK
ncbi:MAG: hypothetical protein J7L71_10105 [Spirochaetaceae bacterium]|nr:hypothetical protein [Spirochaetaceae bacterium]